MREPNSDFTRADVILLRELSADALMRVPKDGITDAAPYLQRGVDAIALAERIAKRLPPE